MFKQKQQKNTFNYCVDTDMYVMDTDTVTTSDLINWHKLLKNTHFFYNSFIHLTMC